jgi:hypothetical protein
VHVVADATDDYRFEALVVSDSGHIRPEFGLKVLGQALVSFLRAEDYVDSIA